MPQSKHKMQKRSSVILILTSLAIAGLITPAGAWASGGDQSDASSGPPSVYPLRFQWYRLAEGARQLEAFYEAKQVRAAQPSQNVQLDVLMLSLKEGARLTDIGAREAAKKTTAAIRSVAHLHELGQLAFESESAEREFTQARIRAEVAAKDFDELMRDCPRRTGYPY